MKKKTRKQLEKEHRVITDKCIRDLTKAVDALLYHGVVLPVPIAADLATVILNSTPA